MPAGSLIVQTLLSGEVGIASLAPPSAVSAWARGAELAIVAGGIEQALNVLMVNPRPTIARCWRKLMISIATRGKACPTVRREGIQQALDGVAEGKNTKLNIDNLIDNSLIQELDKEGFLREIDAVKR